MTTARTLISEKVLLHAERAKLRIELHRINEDIRKFTKDQFTVYHYSKESKLERINRINKRLQELC